MIYRPTITESVTLARRRVANAMPLGWPHVLELLRCLGELQQQARVAEAERDGLLRRLEKERRAAAGEEPTTSYREERGTAGEPRG